jgi:hypothetical protein
MPDPMQQGDEQEDPFKVDLIAPDIYASGYRDFQRLCQVYGAFEQEPGEGETGWAATGCDLLVSYHDRDGAARGMQIQQSPDEFLLVGVGFSVRFCWPRPDGRPVPVLSAEWERYEGDRWIPLHPRRRGRPESAGAPVTLLEPGVVRVVLAGSV